MHESIMIANRLIDLAKKDKKQFTPMQLLKLVYIAHGWMLALYDRPLIMDRVQAWKYGPVIPQLYHAAKDYRNKPVDKPLETALDGFFNLESPEEEPAGDRLDPLEEDLLEQVYTKYGNKGGIELSRITHLPDTPWDQIYQHNGFDIEIPNELIQQHYKKLAAGAARDR